MSKIKVGDKVRIIKLGLYREASRQGLFVGKHGNSGAHLCHARHRLDLLSRRTEAGRGGRMKIYIGARVKVRDTEIMGQVLGALPTADGLQWMVMRDDNITGLFTTPELEGVA